MSKQFHFKLYPFFFPDQLLNFLRHPVYAVSISVSNQKMQLLISYIGFEEKRFHVTLLIPETIEGEFSGVNADHLISGLYSDTEMIFKYLNQFMITEDWQLLQSWNGIYPKMTHGVAELLLNPEPGVCILNGLGAAGMTLSFGFAEETVSAF